METNAIIKINGYKALVKELGEVQAEKFISLVQQIMEEIQLQWYLQTSQLTATLELRLLLLT